jgi:outer membrane protein OmpA-like peptidoglycan-associated protein
MPSTEKELADPFQKFSGEAAFRAKRFNTFQPTSQEKLMTYKASPLVAFAQLALGLIILVTTVTPARADPADDARIRQLRLMCALRFGDEDAVTNPLYMMMFQQCLRQAGTNSGNGGVAAYAPGQLYNPYGQPLYKPGGQPLYTPGKALVSPGKALVGPGQALVGPGQALVGPGRALVSPGNALLVQETQKEVRLRLPGDLLFDYDKSDLRPDAVATLREGATRIKAANPRSKILIAGYTDSKGSVPFNMQLSQQGAWSVETWLVQNAGFPASVFSPVGYGATNPVAPNETPDGHDDPDGRQRNRRVEIIIPK